MLILSSSNNKCRRSDSHWNIARPITLRDFVTQLVSCGQHSSAHVRRFIPRTKPSSGSGLTNSETAASIPRKLHFQLQSTRGSIGRSNTIQATVGVTIYKVTICISCSSNLQLRKSLLRVKDRQVVLAYITDASASGQHHGPLELIKQNLDREISSSLSFVGEPPDRYPADETEVSTESQGLEDV